MLFRMTDGVKKQGPQIVAPRPRSKPLGSIWMTNLSYNDAERNNHLHSTRILLLKMDRPDAVSIVNQNVCVDYTRKVFMTPITPNRTKYRNSIKIL